MTPPTALWVFPAWFITVILAGALGAWCAWPVAFGRGFEEAVGKERHRHRVGDPKVPGLPRAGRLALEPPLEPLPPGPARPGSRYYAAAVAAPEPEGAFFGAPVQPRTAPAEYELMTRTMTMAATSATAEAPADETPSQWTRRQALEMDAFIKGMTEESNYFQHTILAGRLRIDAVRERTAEGAVHGRHEAGAR